MELFESELLDQNQTALAVEPEPRYQPTTTASLPSQTNEHGHTWIRTIGLILAALILIAAIVLLARWAYHRTHHAGSKNGSSKVTTNPKLSDAERRARSGSAPQKSRPSNPSSSDTTATPPAGNPKITNAGPGNVAGLFVGTSLAAAGLHFVISLRRFNRA